MGIETLRQLVQDHARGKIDRLHYRKQRAQLIDDITEVVDADQPEPADPSPADPSPISAPDNSPQMADRHVKVNTKLVVTTAALIILVLLVVFLSENADPIEQQADASSIAAAIDAETIINTFLEYDTWSSERVSQFVADWQNLSEQQKQKVKQAALFQTLVNEMNKRLDEQQALARSGSQEAQQQAQSIRSLAILLNINLLETS